MRDPDRLLLTGAQVADGTGGPLRAADVLITGDRIEAVEQPGKISNVATRDLHGLVLAPGFIDTHSHADNAPLLTEDDTTKILQGVTTEVVGNCGFSLAPRLAEHADTFTAFSARLFPPIDWAWAGFDELFQATEKNGYVTNYCPLVGHGTLRIAAMGMADAVADDEAVAVMRTELEAAMSAGAFGLSSGLIYPPAVYSSTTELVRLAEVLGGTGLYATHMRNEGAGLLDAIAEALEIGAAAGRTHISHLKTSGRPNWGRMPDALAAIRQARAAGQRISHDVYPYDASSTMLATVLPPSYLADGEAAILKRLADPAGGRKELARIITESLPGWESTIRGAGWDGILVATTGSHRYEGQTLAEIAADRGVEPVDALIDVLLDEKLKASMVTFSMNEDDVETALKDEHMMIGSDGLPPGSGGKPHPRLYGTFPRVLGRYRRDRGLMSLPEAVRRMTSLPAETFGIPERGVIAAGKVADLVAFDPDTVADICDYRDPVHDPIGIPLVIQAGQPVVVDGAYAGPRRGRRLTPA
jgi:dihydroorotase/N-acyl-D-amino-acid deacylase